MAAMLLACSATASAGCPSKDPCTDSCYLCIALRCLCCYEHVLQLCAAGKPRFAVHCNSMRCTRANVQCSTHLCIALLAQLDAG